jgi:hypothetical protein
MFQLSRVALLCMTVFISCCASDPDPLDVAFGLTPPRRLSAAQQSEMLKHPLGSAENPVRAHMPVGERAYLGRLVCPNGERPNYERHGSVTQLSPYGTTMDVYGLTCGAEKFTVHIDMYHPDHVEQNAIPGFSIDPHSGS